MKKHTDFVYVVGVRADGAYKIGCSECPDRRVKQLRSAYKTPGLDVIHQVEVANSFTLDGYWVERYLHLAFDHRRDTRRGNQEWFHLTAGDVELIRTFKAISLRTDMPKEIKGLFTFSASAGDIHLMELGRMKRVSGRHPYQVARAVVAADRRIERWSRRALLLEMDRMEEYRQAEAQRMQERFRHLDEQRR